jgi:hypothetical protein
MDSILSHELNGLLCDRRLLLPPMIESISHHFPELLLNDFDWSDIVINDNQGIGFAPTTDVVYSGKDKSLTIRYFGLIKNRPNFLVILAYPDRVVQATITHRRDRAILFLSENERDKPIISHLVELALG